MGKKEKVGGNKKLKKNHPRKRNKSVFYYVKFCLVIRQKRSYCRCYMYIYVFMYSFASKTKISTWSTTKCPVPRYWRKRRVQLTLQLLFFSSVPFISKSSPRQAKGGWRKKKKTKETPGSAGKKGEEVGGGGILVLVFARPTPNVYKTRSVMYGRVSKNIRK